ncbi:MAG: Na+dependent transporter, partial [Fervidobacterium sp.]
LFSTIQYIKDGYFNLIPKFVLSTPELIPWVIFARVVLAVVFILSFVLTYRSLSDKLDKQIESK